jgi:glycosyltransferase involved in cell wall biosynthesis
MKVLLINPWGVNNDQYYMAGFIAGMNKLTSISIASNYYYLGTKPNGKIYPVFFKYSEKMPNSVSRKIIRGIEYIIAWMKILKIIKREKYDVIHIHWLLMYKIDLFFLKRIHKYTKKIILTAHNVIPHINGEKNIQILNEIYANFDIILVHGESIKNEFLKMFPFCVDKVCVQYHGEYFGQSTLSCGPELECAREIVKKVQQFDKIFITFGFQFFNKGTDRLVDIWIKQNEMENSLLIIAGKIDESYVELSSKVDKIKREKNIIILDYYVEKEFLNFCITKSNVIILPYRHASMSGVVYTAAVFAKPIICTNVGALSEYLEDYVDSFICENTEKALTECILRVQQYSNEKLMAMGLKMKKNIHEKYSWELITRNLYKNVYSDVKNKKK